MKKCTERYQICDFQMWKEVGSRIGRTGGTWLEEDSDFQL